MLNAEPAPTMTRSDGREMRRRGSENRLVRLTLIAAVTVIAAACSSAGETPTPSPIVTPSPTATATTQPGGGACGSDQLSARISDWQGAAGSRIATVELTNDGSAECTLPAASRPALVDAGGAVLIDGATPAGGVAEVIGSGQTVTTLVRVANYCGATPQTPLSIAIVLPGETRVVAEPLSPTDTTVPPCMSEPGSPGSIEMQAWTPSS